MTQQPNGSDKALETIVPQTKEKNVNVTALAEFFSGPLPHPSILQGYEEACSGSAEKIIKMAIDEQAHRHRMNETAVQFEERQIKRGQVFGLIIALATLGCSVVIVLFGGSLATTIIGSVLGVGGLASIVTAFVYSRDKDRPSGGEAENIE